MKRKAKMFECDASAGNGYWLQTPFNQDFVDTLKGELPRYSRKWDAHRKMWWVSDDYCTEALLISRRFYRVDTPASLEPRAAQNAWDVLWLREGAPQECIRAVYRALSLTHHPDTGGNVQIQKQLNLAYEELTK